MTYFTLCKWVEVKCYMSMERIFGTSGIITGALVYNNEL